MHLIIKVTSSLACLQQKLQLHRAVSPIVQGFLSGLLQTAVNHLTKSDKW